MQKYVIRWESENSNLSLLFVDLIGGHKADSVIDRKGCKEDEFPEGNRPGPNDSYVETL